MNVDVHFLRSRSKTCLMAETLQAGFLIPYRASYFLILLLQLQLDAFDHWGQAFLQQKREMLKEMEGSNPGG